MKKILTLLMALSMMLMLLAACGGDKTSSTSQSDSSQSTSSSSDESGQDEDAEIVDGRFVETRKITVEIYDRGNDGGTDPTDNFFTDYIKEGMLRDHNVEVEFQAIPRWTETEALNNVLAAQSAPDICVTYSYPTIQEYANMGGVIDLTPYLEEYWHLVPDMVDLITEDNVWFDQDPDTKELWAIEARLFNDVGLRTFVREDWLAALDMKAPQTFDEFEEMLYTFKDNAETLLGSDAGQIVPYWMSSDVGWHLKEMVNAYLPADITDRDLYINGFDDRDLLTPNYKELVRRINKWYNDGLLWTDFALYEPTDEAGGNILKQGYAGSYTQNYDNPYRDGEDGIQNTMSRLAGDDAAFVAITPFDNENGTVKKILGTPVDRKVFFPSTNTEPVASLMYLNFICKVENRVFLQTGEEGKNHERGEDGSYIDIDAMYTDYAVNSARNIDYTILYNGLALNDAETTAKSMAQGFAGIDSKYIMAALDLSNYDEIYYKKNVQTGEIAAESGMSEALNAKRDAFLNQAVVAPVDKFDAIFDAGMQDYLASGGQAIIDERTAAWEAIYGDAVTID